MKIGVDQWKRDNRKFRAIIGEGMVGTLNAIGLEIGKKRQTYDFGIRQELYEALGIMADRLDESGETMTGDAIRWATRWKRCPMPNVPALPQFPTANWGWVYQIGQFPDEQITLSDPYWIFSEHNLPKPPSPKLPEYWRNSPRNKSFAEAWFDLVRLTYKPFGSRLERMQRLNAERLKGSKFNRISICYGAQILESAGGTVQNHISTIFMESRTHNPPESTSVRSQCLTRFMAEYSINESLPFNVKKHLQQGIDYVGQFADVEWNLDVPLWTMQSDIRRLRQYSGTFIIDGKLV